MSSVMIRRLKKDVLKELPPKIRQRIEIDTEECYIKEIRELFGVDKDVVLTEKVKL